MAYFYPRSPCGERLGQGFPVQPIANISIHALLAESDLLILFSSTSIPIFLSTLSLRRATKHVFQNQLRYRISIHALLAESDKLQQGRNGQNINFYPRSPCGERLWVLRKVPILGIFLSTLSLRRATYYFAAFLCLLKFLSTLSLRRATFGLCEGVFLLRISIHALLAESDLGRVEVVLRILNFYPRSPCGERHKAPPYNLMIQQNFYPRSPCGERLNRNVANGEREEFLSTLSLRRATFAAYPPVGSALYFYPRSPCGERPLTRAYECSKLYISIHALLAESDIFRLTWHPG